MFRETLVTENYEAYQLAFATFGDENLSPFYLLQQPLSVLDDCPQFVPVNIC